MVSKISKGEIKISVILSTFNRPRALKLVLESLCNQKDCNFEIIVADDGSEASTKIVIEETSRDYSNVCIHHVWHENKGFRLAKIRNLAVLKSTGDYLIFLDGDCVPSPNFITKHRDLMERGWVVYGQRILASKDYTSLLIEDQSITLRASFWTLLNLVVLWRAGFINRFLPAVKFPNFFWRKFFPKKWENIRGCNLAMWRYDYINVNGSDESFEGWGAEDKDLVVRLINNGILLKNGSFYSYVLHLWHLHEPREKSKENMIIVNRRLIDKVIFPSKGIKNV